MYRRYLAFSSCAVILICVCLAGCDHNNPAAGNRSTFSAREDFRFDIPIASYDDFTLSGISGEIVIEGRDDLTLVEIWGEKIVRAATQQRADDLLDDLKVQLDTVGQRLQMFTEQPQDGSDWDFVVEYHVRIPRECCTTSTVPSG